MKYINDIKEKIKRIRIQLNLHLVLGILSVCGVLGGVYLVILSSIHLPSGMPITPPSSSPYQYFIAGEGIIESSTENIQLSTLNTGIVKKIYVKVGDKVKKGDPLFLVDDQQALVNVTLQETQVEQTKSALTQAKAQMISAKDQYDLAKRVKDKRAISEINFLTLKNTYLVSCAALENAKQILKVSESQLKVAQVNRDLLTVKAPVDCEVLQINIHPGEFANQSILTGDYIAMPTNTPLMLLGGMKELHIRVDIDENDAWRYENGAKAVAFLRGNSAIKLELEFVRTEPFVVPKTSLTGLSSEQVDTRVLQVIYRFDAKDLPVFIGQQVDVYMEVSEEREKKYAPIDDEKKEKL